MLFIFAFLLIVILVVLVRCIVIVPQSNAYVTEWLGVYKDTWGAGLHIRTPFVERISRKVSLKEEAADFPPQPVITRDNVTMMIPRCTPTASTARFRPSRIFPPRPCATSSAR